MPVNEELIPEPMEPARCPDCGAYTDFRFNVPVGDIPAFYVNDEWVSLGEFPVVVYCRECPWSEEGVGSQFTIKTSTGVITFGKIRREESQ